MRRRSLDRLPLPRAPKLDHRKVRQRREHPGRSSGRVGDVAVPHDSDNTRFDAQDLTVTFARAGPFPLPGAGLSAITTGSPEYHDAMVAASPARRRRT